MRLHDDEDGRPPSSAEDMGGTSYARTKTGAGASQ